MMFLASIDHLGLIWAISLVAVGAVVWAIEKAANRWLDDDDED